MDNLLTFVRAINAWLWPTNRMENGGINTDDSPVRQRQLRLGAGPPKFEAGNTSDVLITDYH